MIARSVLPNAEERGIIAMEVADEIFNCEFFDQRSKDSEVEAIWLGKSHSIQEKASFCENLSECCNAPVRKVLTVQGPMAFQCHGCSGWCTNPDL